MKNLPDSATANPTYGLFYLPIRIALRWRIRRPVVMAGFVFFGQDRGAHLFHTALWTYNADQVGAAELQPMRFDRSRTSSFRCLQVMPAFYRIARVPPKSFRGFAVRVK